jgi:Fur family transcriptional regulator, ferric uptake regulator
MPLRKHNTEQQQEAITEAAWETFVAFIRHKADRVSRARRIVFRRIFERHDHFRADDLALDLMKGKDRVSRGTIYRTLALMVEANLVREVRDSDTHIHYEHIFGHDLHEHLICNMCGQFIEFRDWDISARVLDICAETGFRPTGHRVTVFGACKECLDAKAAEDNDAAGSA